MTLRRSRTSRGSPIVFYQELFQLGLDNFTETETLQSSLGLGTPQSILVDEDGCFLDWQTLTSPRINMELWYWVFSGRTRYVYRKTRGILELMISSLPRATTKLSN